MSHLIARTKQVCLVILFVIALVTTFITAPSSNTLLADGNPTPTPTEPAGPEGWTDPIGG